MLIAIFRTVILYAFIILAIRLMGKRQISDMQPSELVVTLVVSDIASLPMQNTSQPLLSGVVLADTREQALRLRSMLCPGQSVVTAAGDLFRADGSAVSGIEGRQKLLSRTREIRELSEEQKKTAINRLRPGRFPV